MRSVVKSLGVKAALAVAAVAATGMPVSEVGAQSRPLSPRGHTATQIGGAYNDEGRYEGGYWIDIHYGRPILSRPAGHLRRGRGVRPAHLRGGAYCGGSAPIRRPPSPPRRISAHRRAAAERRGVHDVRRSCWRARPGMLDADLRAPGASSRPSGEDDPNALWGAYGYDDSKDVMRTTMTVETVDWSLDQLQVGFLDMTRRGRHVLLNWDNSCDGADRSGELRVRASGAVDRLYAGVCENAADAAARRAISSSNTGRASGPSAPVPAFFVSRTRRERGRPPTRMQTAATLRVPAPRIAGAMAFPAPGWTLSRDPRTFARAVHAPADRHHPLRPHGRTVPRGARPDHRRHRAPDHRRRAGRARLLLVGGDRVPAVLHRLHAALRQAQRHLRPARCTFRDPPSSSSRRSWLRAGFRGSRLVMQVSLLAVQNAVEHRDRGHRHRVGAVLPV